MVRSGEESCRVPPALAVAGSGHLPRAAVHEGGPAMERVTIWHTSQQRKIVGNAAPMAKNLQDYLDKHVDCEIYTGQDKPGAEKQENPMDVSRRIARVLPPIGCRRPAVCLPRVAAQTA